MIEERNDVLIAGIDEAGRGPLAGPVVAAAVILDPSRRVRGLRRGCGADKYRRDGERQQIALEYHVSSPELSRWSR